MYCIVYLISAPNPSHINDAHLVSTLSNSSFLVRFVTFSNFKYEENLKRKSWFWFHGLIPKLKKSYLFNLRILVLEIMPNWMGACRKGHSYSYICHCIRTWIGHKNARARPVRHALVLPFTIHKMKIEIGILLFFFVSSLRISHMKEFYEFIKVQGKVDGPKQERRYAKK